MALTTLQLQKFYNETKAHSRVQRYENMDDLSLSNKTIRGLHTMLRQFCEAFGFEVGNNGATAIIRTK